MSPTRSVALLSLLLLSTSAFADPLPTTTQVERTKLQVDRVIPEGISPITKTQLEVIDGIKAEVDLGDPPWSEGDSAEDAKRSFDALETKYDDARRALTRVSSDDTKKSKVKKRTKWVDDFEQVLLEWEALLAETYPPEEGE